MTKDRRWLKSVLATAAATAQIEMPFHRSARLKQRLAKAAQKPATAAR